MKKSFYFAALAVAVLSSCSSDPVVKPNAEVDNDLVPIELGVGTPLMTVTTRGTGTVGSTTAADNHWRYEHVRVLMTWIPDDVEEHSWGFTTRNEGDNEGDYYLFGNQFYCLPDESQTSESGGVALVPELKGNKVRYYPGRGSSNFFAYYVDDAIDPADTQDPVYDSNDKAPAIHDTVFAAENLSAKYVNFKMDGTQDIMAGMAPHDGKGFSARTARAGTHPHISMKHLLTRLTFKVVPGNQNAEKVKVKSISVESPCEGKLTVAYNSNTPKADNELITWSKDEDTNVLKSDTFELKSYNTSGLWYDDVNKTKNSLGDLLPFDFETEFNWNSLTFPCDYKSVAKSIGHAMFVAPGQTNYPLLVVLDNNAQEAGFADSKMNLNIALDGGAPLEMGKSYEIIIVVYGLSKIEVYATLTNWDVSDEDLILDDDND